MFGGLPAPSGLPVQSIAAKFRDFIGTEFHTAAPTTTVSTSPAAGVHVHDLNATALHCLGLEHTRLTYRFQGRDYRLTDVEGNVIQDIPS